MPHDIISLALAGGVLAGCSGNSDNAEKKFDSAATEQKAAAPDEVKAPESDVAMKYITPADAEARAILARVFPDHEIVMIPGREMLLGGGNIHCLTQQQPAPSKG